MADNIDFRVRHGLAVTNTATVESTLTSVSTASGALVVKGGVGIAKDVYVGGIFSATGSITSGGDLEVTGAVTILSPTESNDTASGALEVVGGAGIGKNLNVGGSQVLAGSLTVNSTTESNDTASGALEVVGGAGIGGNANIGGKVTIQSSTGSVSTQSGALTVGGGVGIGETLYVGKDLYVGGILYGTILGSISTATNLFSGSAGQVPYQTGPGITSFYGPGTAGQLLVSNGAAAPIYTNTSSIYVRAAELSNKLIGGATGSIPYQSSPNITEFLAGGATGAMLKYNGTAPIWATTASFTGGTASDAAANGQSVRVYSGGIGIQGNSYFSNNVGIGGAITIAGATTFNGIVTFNGTATYVYSSNSVLTDSLIVLHNNSATEWTYSDNLDIGIVGDYYDTQTNSAKSFFFGFAPEERYLKFLVNGSEDTPGNFAGDFGDLKLNTILLVSTATSTNSDTGALVVPGGVGIRGNVNVQDTGQLVVGINLAQPLPDSPLHTAGDVNSYFQIHNQNVNSGIYASGDYVATSNDGDDGNFYINMGIASSNFAHPDFSMAGPHDGYLYVQGGDLKIATGSTATNIEFWLEGTASTSTGLLFTTTNVGSKVASIEKTGITVFSYTSATSTTTGALQVRGGAGIAGDLWIGGVIYGTASITGQVTTATNLAGGLTGQVPYQNLPGVTEFFGPGTAGQFLKSNGSAAPTYVNTSTMYVGYSVTATNVNAGQTGQLVYQTEPGRTEFVGTGTAGQLLMSAGTTSTGPVFTNTSSIYVNNAVFADNIKLGTAGQIPYQITTSTTGFFGPGTRGQLLIANGTSATIFAGPGTTGQLLVSAGANPPVYTNTSSIYVGRAALADLATLALDANRATTATNLAGGATGSIPYQSTSSSTTFLPIGTSTYVLTSDGSVPVWTTPDGLVAGSADTIKVTNNTTSTQTHFITFISTSTGYGDINVAATTGITYVPSTGNVGIHTATPGVTLDVNSTTNAVIRAFGSNIGKLSLQNNSKHYSVSVQGSDLLVYDESAGATRFRISNTGDVGIGVTPTAKLDVLGTVKISGITNITNATTASNTSSGALQVAGGIGVGNSIYVKNRVGYVNNSNVSRVYQYYNAATDSLDTVFE
jgi:hypothetical protein